MEIVTWFSGTSAERDLLQVFSLQRTVCGKQLRHIRNSGNGF